MINTDCRDFLLHSASLLNWGDLSGKVVMDVGCGSEAKSTFRLAELFPNMKSLIGLDKCFDMIVTLHGAHRNHPLIGFQVGAIDERRTMVVWENDIDVVVSNFCFNCIKNQTEAFRNVYRLLCPGGSAAFRFTLWSNFYDWVKEIGETYAELADDFDKDPPESHTLNYQASHYIQVLTDIGFNIVECEDETSSHLFRTDIECRNYLGTICPITSKLRSGPRDEFLHELFFTFLKHSPRNYQGLVSLNYRTAKILVTKPEDESSDE